MSNGYLGSQEEDPVPSYEESIHSASVHREKGGRLVASSPLHRQLDDERLRRVQSILTRYVDPLLFIQGTSGLYKSIFLLIPSNVHTLQVKSGHNDADATSKE